jgi:hypothetical protein
MVGMRKDVSERAKARLGRDAAAYRKAITNLDAARTRLVEAVHLATKVGVGQGEILRATDHVWTREHLRQLAKVERDRAAAATEGGTT